MGKCLCSVLLRELGSAVVLRAESGFVNHNPTKSKAPTYTCKGAKPPVEDSCSPGPHSYVEPSMTRNGKYVAPVYPICGCARANTESTAGPITCLSCKAVSDSYEAFLDIPLDIKVVEYPEYLDLRPYTSQTAGEPLLCALYAVLVHRETMQFISRYRCLSLQASNRLWYKMNDPSVDGCGTDTVLRQQGYLLFYVR
ncbi:hypothetical protein QYF61_005501 [Mycteria americana]|uniref:Ubiquitin carboxyl-terminal hydrolase 36 n=1 Tax=Mycteria americana TaxID=33587 RepID=A0AAN7MIB5_MYCAM|nr:hypothetical protein QYF61_005501 [Mycteria americana]